MATTYKPLEAISLLRPAFRPTRKHPHPQFRILKATFSTSRTSNAAPNSTTSPPNPPSGPSVPQRRAVTVTNDTGAIKWRDLSLGEKAARTTQQSFNVSIILVGIVLTGGISYYLFTEVFSPSSKTAYFNRAVTAIRSSSECTKILGPADQIYAHGNERGRDATGSRWSHNREIRSSTEKDRMGNEHLRIRFFVEGPLERGTVNVHVVKRAGESEWVYETLCLDVKGHHRIYLEGGEEKRGGKTGPKVFGMRWW